VPEVASRQHVIDIRSVVTNALLDAGVTWGNLDVISVTHGPGLAGSLIIGLNMAKGLSASTGIPLVGVNHLEGHIFAAWAKTDSLEKIFGQPFDESLHRKAILTDKIDTLSRLTMTDSCAVPPIWMKKFLGTSRFVAILNGAAYCDQETGIVWETSPSGGSFDWVRAITHCATREIGARKGWSLPSREQLASLVDTNSGLCTGGGLCLPETHPFQNVQSANYWSATTTAGSPTFAWVVNFFFGSSLVINWNGDGLAWCMRGGEL